MKQAIVFLGPTLSHEEAGAILDAQYLPPAAHGDVLRAALRRPRVIAIIDGVFEQVPAVWHKEILFALSEGVHVYGAASMGALRAAELDTFGMRGVGQVYRAYADGMIEDDDEVAVAHGSAEDGYRATSDAMVDIRATLDAAVADGITDQRTAGAILVRLKETFYPQRLLLGALERGNESHERLRAWLGRGRVQRKRDDAIAMLRTIDAALAVGLEPSRRDWTFQITHYWADARHAVAQATHDEQGSVSAPMADEELEAVLNELRLDPARYARLLDRALLAALARTAAAAAGVDESSWAHQSALDDERRLRGQLTPEDSIAWLTDHGQTEADLPAIARRLAVLRWAERSHRDAVVGELALTVRSDDGYRDLAARASSKHAFLAAQSAADAAVIDASKLISWYFHKRLGQEIPGSLDMWASAYGWRTVGELVRALRAEWRFIQRGDANHPGGSPSISA